MGSRTRAAIIRTQRITGLTPDVIAELVAKIDPLWHERHQVVLASRLRSRAVGAGAKYELAFVGRLMATLVHLRRGATHDVVACCSVSTAPPLRVRSVKCGHCSPSGAAPSLLTSG